MIVYLSGGKKLEIGSGATVVEVIKTLNLNEKDPIIAAKINGKLSDLTKVLNEGDEIELLNFDTPEGKQVFWHSSSHVLAQAVQELFPSAKLAIGPSIENGFYYDFDNDIPFSPEDLDKIERKAKEIIERKLNIVRLEPSKEELKEYFQKKNEIYKLELLEEIEGSPTAYKQGDWMDLCRGP
ncbi:MAG: TGS domain-containing protein, partial [Chitinispirillaceae bacterium]|nr:TGS domain-containing protein [Chitinispirillaceae bacterium]